jgi:hypothetical protein
LVFVTGSIGRDRDRPNIIVEEITPIDQALESFIGGVQVRLPAPPQTDLWRQIADALRASIGPCPVHVLVRPIHRPDVLAEVRLGREMYIQPTRTVINKLEELLGDQALLKLQPRPPAAPQRKNARRWSNNSKPQAGRATQVSEAVTRFN